MELQFGRIRKTLSRTHGRHGVAVRLVFQTSMSITFDGRTTALSTGPVPKEPTSSRYRGGIVDVLLAGVAEFGTQRVDATVFYAGTGHVGQVICLNFSLREGAPSSGGTFFQINLPYLHWNDAKFILSTVYRDRQPTLDQTSTCPSMILFDPSEDLIAGLLGIERELGPQFRRHQGHAGTLWLFWPIWPILDDRYASRLQS